MGICLWLHCGGSVGHVTAIDDIGTNHGALDWRNELRAGVPDHSLIGMGSGHRYPGAWLKHDMVMAQCQFLRVDANVYYWHGFMVFGGV